MAIYKATRPRRRTLIALIVLSIVLITLDLRGQGAIAAVRNNSRDVLAPVQRVVGGVFTGVGDWASGVVRAGSLRRENADLKRKLQKAHVDAKRGEAATRENKKLTDLLHIPNLEGIPTVAARVVGGSPSDFSWTIEIDHGTSSGVRVGMPVVASDGLVGRVLEASRGRSTVLLITDPSSGVGARLERSGANGVARGRAGKSTLGLDFVPPNVSVTAKELVVTSGLQGGRFPAGIPIGNVKSVRANQGELQQTIEVQPLVNPSKLEFVRVLRWSGQ